MALLLKAPYEEKDEAKALGAKWNPQLKKWYVEARKDYYKFTKWILGDREQVYILCDCFYIAEGVHTCFKCRNSTRVIGYGRRHSNHHRKNEEHPVFLNYPRKPPPICSKGFGVF